MRMLVWQMPEEIEKNSAGQCAPQANELPVQPLVTGLLHCTHHFPKGIPYMTSAQGKKWDLQKEDAAAAGG